MAKEKEKKKKECFSYWEWKDTETETLQSRFKDLLAAMFMLRETRKKPIPKLLFTYR